MKKLLLLIMTITASHGYAEEKISLDDFARLTQDNIPASRMVLVGDTWSEKSTSIMDDEGCITEENHTYQILKKTSRGFYQLVSQDHQPRNCGFSSSPASSHIEFVPNYTSEDFDISDIQSVTKLGENTYRLEFTGNDEDWAIVEYGVPAYRMRTWSRNRDFTTKFTSLGIKPIKLDNQPLKLCTYVPLDDSVRVRMCEDGIWPSFILGNDYNHPNH